MDTTPPTSSVNSLPATTTATSFTVSVTGTDPAGSNGSTPSKIKSFAIYVSKNGGVYSLLATVTPGNPSTLFTGQVGNTYGFYSVATDNAGNEQATPSSAQQTVQILSALSVNSFTPVSPNPRNTYVSSIDVTFSEPINTSSLVTGALTLTDDGGPNLINSGVSLSLISGNTYAIGGLMGLTAAQGDYTLTVNSADIKDQNGIAGTNSLPTSWLMDTTAPSSHVVNSLGTSQTSDTFSVSVSFTDPTGPGNAPASGELRCSSGTPSITERSPLSNDGHLSDSLRHGGVLVHRTRSQHLCIPQHRHRRRRQHRNEERHGHRGQHQRPRSPSTGDPGFDQF